MPLSHALASVTVFFPLVYSGKRDGMSVGIDTKTSHPQITMVSDLRMRITEIRSKSLWEHLKGMHYNEPNFLWL